jgi:hypothetical protein
MTRCSHPRLAAALLMLSVVAAATASAAEHKNQHKKLQQPLVPASKLECQSSSCMSLSTSVLLSDECWRTCTAHCGGQFQACVGLFWLNDCRVAGDHCDTGCQKQCRTYGGPLLDLAY